ncbi:MAG TPA: ABC transporter ATP-binding protein [Stellaceae bacterium]|jgi:branched-chain amino acid transport system ATP-binding protein|nr:ABC transporter ATP-binding protein [Stellaceae bacterium]
MSALGVRDLSKRFRGLQAVNGVSFDVPDRGIVALIGPNGAGKTTTFNLIAGAIHADAGEVRLDGLRLDGLPPHRVCAAGVARTFQLVRPFGELDVADNVLVGCLHGERDIARAKAAARDILQRLGLWEQRHRLASSLTLPDRKRLEVARALGTQPKILLLDEVMAGLRPVETDQMVAFFRAINRELGITILLIEHVMRAVMALAHRIVVLNHGEKIAEGAPAEIVRDPAVLECYLGEEEI